MINILTEGEKRIKKWYNVINNFPLVIFSDKKIDPETYQYNRFTGFAFSKGNISKIIKRKSENVIDKEVIKKEHIPQIIDHMIKTGTLKVDEERVYLNDSK